MAKGNCIYVCSECGSQSPKWSGQCENCGSWNTIEKTVPVTETSLGFHTGAGQKKPGKIRPINEINADDEVRYSTGMKEVDRLLGGGIVKGSLVLIGGDPGIGKSTLLLQICKQVGEDCRVLYVSGEESARQLKLRADRLHVFSKQLYILSETNLDRIIATVSEASPDLVVIDSIQTMLLEGISSSPGSITQVRECTSALMRMAKTLDIPVFLVGHVNKAGNIAGPKVLEHIVDVVLSFEGESNFAFRILRAIKNRYGSTNEIAVFEMGEEGLSEVDNPSAMLLKERPEGVSGTCVCSVIEGSRPIMAEVQALVTKTGFGTPRRMSAGFDYNRMSLILAVLEKRAGYLFGALDTYVNVVGGLRLDEPGADVAIALALISSLRDIPVDSRLFAFGEIGLAGEIRSVVGVQKRVSEAIHLGFTKIVLPRSSVQSVGNMLSNDVELIPVTGIRQAISIVFGEG